LAKRIALGPSNDEAAANLVPADSEVQTFSPSPVDSQLASEAARQDFSAPPPVVVASPPPQETSFPLLESPVPQEESPQVVGHVGLFAQFNPLQPRPPSPAPPLADSRSLAQILLESGITEESSRWTRPLDMVRPSHWQISKPHEWGSTLASGQSGGGTQRILLHRPMQHRWEGGFRMERTSPAPQPRVRVQPSSTQAPPAMWHKGSRC